MSVEEDPFKPVDDPQETKPARGRRKTPTPVEEKPGPVGPHGEVGLSVKFGSGYEAPMFHVKATDIYTLAALVGYDGDTEVSTRKFAAGLMAWWSNVARIVQDEYKGSKPASDSEGESKPRSGGSGTRNTSQARSGGSSRPSGRTQRDADDADTDWMYDQEVPPECDHGEWRPVTKVGAKGRWFAWGCPGGKDDSCDNGLEFVRKK